jgi:hypothetical protein
MTGLLLVLAKEPPHMAPSKTRRSQGGSYPLRYLYETCGLVRLTRLRRDVPWAKA